MSPTFGFTDAFSSGPGLPTISCTVISLSNAIKFILPKQKFHFILPE